MITTLVQFQLPTAITLEEATRRFETSAPKYQNLAGLIRKYYIRSEDGRIAGGIYLARPSASMMASGASAWRNSTARAPPSPGSTVRLLSTISPAAPSRKQHSHATR